MDKVPKMSKVSKVSIKATVAPSKPGAEKKISPAPQASIAAKDVRRMQSIAAKKGGGKISKDSHITRIQGAHDRQSKPELRQTFARTIELIK